MRILHISNVKWDSRKWALLSIEKIPTNRIHFDTKIAPKYVPYHTPNLNIIFYRTLLHIRIYASGISSSFSYHSHYTALV